MTDRLIPFTFKLVLTTGATEQFEYTAYTPESAARGAVDAFHRENPTKRIDHALLPWVTGIRKWIPHLEGWEHEQPDFIKAGRRDGPNPADGTEI
jgi:hypothetical protein